MEPQGLGGGGGGRGGDVLQSKTIPIPNSQSRSPLKPKYRRPYTNHHSVQLLGRVTEQDRRSTAAGSHEAVIEPAGRRGKAHGGGLQVGWGGGGEGLVRAPSVLVLEA